MDNVNETCESIIDTLHRIEEQQLQFYKLMMEKIEIIKRNLNQK